MAESFVLAHLSFFYFFLDREITSLFFHLLLLLLLNFCFFRSIFPSLFLSLKIKSLRTSSQIVEGCCPIQDSKRRGYFEDQTSVAFMIHLSRLILEVISSQSPFRRDPMAYFIRFSLPFTSLLVSLDSF